ncbi:exported hypothetical protein [groundwater metagenome]|uniref:CARDB domain-containing protein n=1 Tax=groundwater metagenome TaxID=717931 RepID=A0A098E745_9ZZZZ
MEKQHDQIKSRKMNSKNTTKTIPRNIILMLGLIIFVCVGLSFAEAYQVTSTEIPPTSLIVNYGLSQIDEIEVGENGNAIIVIQNVGGLEAKDVEVVTHDTQYLSAESHQKLGTINPGGSVSVVVPIKVSKDAKIGITFIPVSLSYKSYSLDMMRMTKDVKDINIDWSIPIKIKGTPLFSLKNFSVDGNPEPGKKFTLTIRFKNNKGEAKDTYILAGNNNANQQISSVSASSNQVLSVIGMNKKFLGDIKQGDEIEQNFEIYADENAASGVHIFFVKITYAKGGTTKTDEFTIGIFVSGQENIIISDITSEPKKFYAKDKDVKLSLKVQNTGSKEVNYLKISPIYTYPFKNSKSYLQVKNLGKLNAGDEKSADFYFDIDDLAKDGTYELKFLINYKADGIIKEQNISATVEVQEKPNFEISYDLKLVTGEKNSIKLNVKNVGSDCDDVKIYTIAKTDLPFDLTTASQYIGNLKNNEEGEAMIKFSVKSGANEQIYLVPVEIRCVSNNDVFVQSEKIKIEVSKDKSGTNISAYYVYLIILAIILIVIAIFVKFKKAKK